MQVNSPLLLQIHMQDNSLLTLGVHVINVTGHLLTGFALNHEQCRQYWPKHCPQLQLTPGVSRFGCQIPRDASYPHDAGQCDACGGTGIASKPAPGPFADVTQMAREVAGCGVCDAKGWLPAGHPRIRKCENSRCEVRFAPNWVPVYCSNECALMGG